MVWGGTEPYGGRKHGPQLEPRATDRVAVEGLQAQMILCSSTFSPK